MGNLFRNKEGYMDRTAGEAIKRTDKTKKREGGNMGKRSCRRTEYESWIHEKAVKIRKMADDQLVRYIEDQVEKARNEGFNQGRKVNAPQKDGVKEFLSLIKEKKIQGIGAVTVSKLVKVAMENGYL